VAEQEGLTPEEVASRLSATPIQGSPVIRVRATADSAAAAMRLSDSASDSLVEYAFDLNSGVDQSRPLLRRYIAASRDYRRASLKAARLKLSDPRRRRFQVQADIARLKQTVAGVLYQQSLSGQATVNLVQKLAPAAPATNDRDDKLQQFIGGAVIAGLLLGIGLAVWRTNRVTARRLGGR
jgi:hypothetical protein